mgnify:CR=1 FL=1
MRPQLGKHGPHQSGSRGNAGYRYERALCRGCFGSRWRFPSACRPRSPCSRSQNLISGTGRYATWKREESWCLAAEPEIPFFSTDTAAALRAAEIDADIILKATMVDGVYDSDPHKNPSAKKYTELTFSDVLNQNLQVMDSTAASLCRDNKLPIYVFSIEDPDNIPRAVCGEPIGTIVRS